MADNKIIVFAVAALVIGAAIGIGAGALIFKEKSSDETYYFYLYLGDNDAKNGWYKASASDANKALDKAFDGVEGIEVKWSKGYPTVGTASGSYEYLWNETTKRCADESVTVTGTTKMGSDDFAGWRQYNASGLPDDTEKKMGLGNGHIFFLSGWVKIGEQWSLPTPGDVTAWKTAEGTPFATA